MAGSFNPADSGYIEVKDRIEAFYQKYPDGAIRTNIFEASDTRIIVGAEVYANRTDEFPVGTGFSGLEIPGSTPYTKGSELENAETSAVGRAIAMAGFEVKKSVASADEIMSKSTSTRPAAKAASAPSKTTELKKQIRAIAEGMYGEDWKNIIKDGYDLTFTAADGVDKLQDVLDDLSLIVSVEEEVEEADEIPF